MAAHGADNSVYTATVGPLGVYICNDSLIVCICVFGGACRSICGAGNVQHEGELEGVHQIGLGEEGSDDLGPERARPDGDGEEVHLVLTNTIIGVTDRGKHRLGEHLSRSVSTDEVGE